LKRHASLKIWTMDKVLKKKIVSVNITHVVFTLLGLLTLEDRSSRFYQNLSKELSLYAVQYLRKVEISQERLGDASLGLASHGLVQSDLVLVHT